MNVSRLRRTTRSTPARPIAFVRRSEQTDTHSVTPTVGAGGGEAVRDHGFPPAAVGSSPQTRLGRWIAMTVIRPRPLVATSPAGSGRLRRSRPSASLSPRRRSSDRRAHLGTQLPRSPPRHRHRHHRRLIAGAMFAPVRSRRRRDAASAASRIAYFAISLIIASAWMFALVRLPHARSAGRRHRRSPNTSGSSTRAPSPSASSPSSSSSRRSTSRAATSSSHSPSA